MAWSSYCRFGGYGFVLWSHLAKKLNAFNEVALALM